MSGSRPSEGIQPLFLATATCDLFQCQPGAHLTAAKPVKKISKEAILADIQQRRAVSDFQPYKDSIQAYTGDQLVLVLDSHWTYGQNFYLCLTPEAASRTLERFSEKQATTNATQATHSNRKQSRRLPAQGPFPILTPKRSAKGSGPFDPTTESEGQEDDVSGPPHSAGPTVVWEVSCPIRTLESRPCRFSDYTPPDSQVNLNQPTPDDRLAASDVRALERSVACQVVPPLRSQLVQTTPNYPIHRTVQYEPLTLSSEAVEALCADGSELASLMPHFEEWVEAALRENEQVDLLKDSFAGLQTDEDDMNGTDKSRLEMTERFSFIDLRYTKFKSISCICWHPTHPGVLAMSTCLRSTLDERIDQSYKITQRRSLIAFWGLHNTNKALVFLDSTPYDINSFGFHPDHPNLVIGASSGGQVLVWDIAEYEGRFDPLFSPTPGGVLKINLRGDLDAKHALDAPFVLPRLQSSLIGSHTAPIIHLQFVDPQWKVNAVVGSTDMTFSNPWQFMTGSLDGKLNLWNIPVTESEIQQCLYDWKPIRQLLATLPDGTYDFGCSHFLLLPSEDTVPLEAPSPSKTKITNAPRVLCGTEEGDLLAFSLGPDSGERPHLMRNLTLKSHADHSWPAHHSSVVDLRASPFLPHLVLSIGDWSLLLWSLTAMSKGPLWIHHFHTVSVTSVAWSPTRPAVFFVGRSDGVLEVWDLLDTVRGPRLTQTFSSHAIACLSPTLMEGASTLQQGMLAVGDDYGTLKIFHLPRRLTKPVRNEKLQFAALVDRELRRFAEASLPPLAELTSPHQEVDRATSALLDSTRLDKEYEDLVLAHGNLVVQSKT